MGPDARTPDKLANYARELAALYGIDVPWEVINCHLGIIGAHMEHQMRHHATSGLMQIVQYGESDLYLSVNNIVVARAKVH